MAKQIKKQPKQWARDEDKENFWRSEIDLWKVSGLSVSEFCKRHGISDGSFRSWRREISIRDRETSSSSNDVRGVTHFLPDTVKDSRGRVIPARFKKLCQTSEKSGAQSQAAQTPFVPLTVVADKKSVDSAPCSTPVSLEITAPSGFVFKLSCDSNVNFLSSLLKSIEV